MRLKRLLAQDMAHALRLIKSELGDHAIIVSTRKLSAADGKPTLELTVAVDDPLPTAAPSPTTAATVRRLEDVAPHQSRQATHSPHPLDTLLQHGVDLALFEKIQHGLQALHAAGFNAAEGLAVLLGKLLQLSPPASVLPADRPLVVLGPTGVGKTTTIAKLAIRAKQQQRSVRLISLDTYKIGGLEQFQIYADALGLPALIAKDADDLAAAWATASSADLVLIDTPGLNPLETTRLQALKETLQSIAPAFILTLPATLSALQCQQYQQAWGPLGLSALLFTKLDESPALGPLVNAAAQFNLPWCFVADGQRVPHDLLELDATSLAQRLLQPPTLPKPTP